MTNAEKQAQQKIEREAKQQDYYKSDVKKRPASNMAKYKEGVDAREARLIQKQFDDEIEL